MSDGELCLTAGLESPAPGVVDAHVLRVQLLQQLVQEGELRALRDDLEPTGEKP